MTTGIFVRDEVFSELWGFVLYDPVGFVAMGLVPGDDLLSRFTDSSTGDEVCARGYAVPVQGLEAGYYTLVVRLLSEPGLLASPELVSKGWILRVQSQLRISGLGYLANWQPDDAIHVPGLPPGWYEVAIHGGVVAATDGDDRWVVEFVLCPTSSPPNFAGELDLEFNFVDPGNDRE